MVENEQAPKVNKPASDSYVPPPTDPYVTYQTPYPRKPSEDAQNPFIEFRRLADSVFSSFFAGLPKFLGTQQFKESNIRESDQAYAQAFNEQAKDFELRIAEMVRVRAEEAEGFRKKLEQEFEERRRENEKRMEEESRRWEMVKRGLEKCPGLRPEGANGTREVETELDLYNGLHAYNSSAYEPHSARMPEANRCPWKDDKIDKKCPWDEAMDEKGSTRRSWLSGLGFDGRRRAKNIPLYATVSEKEECASETNVDWQEYRDEDMDPFTNDDHVVPWLRLSPYSPLSLLQGWSDQQNQNRGVPDDEISWDEAFEDLMSIHKTGKLPSPVRSLIYWGGPNQWMTEMATRGSLGQNWNEGFMVSALLKAVDGNQWRGFHGFRDFCEPLAGRKLSEHRPKSSTTRHRTEGEEESYSDDWVRLTKDTLQPKLKSAVEEMEDLARTVLGNKYVVTPDRMFGARGMSWPTPDEIISALSEESSNAWNDQTSENKPTEEGRTSTLTQSVCSSPSTRMPSWALANENKSDSIVSTLTTTTSRTLSDGSIETKKVLKKRFADGSEENSESIEVRPSPNGTTNDASTQTTSEQISKVQKPRNGWFWN